MKFGEHLLIERKKKHLTAQALADLCSVSRSYITLIENSTRLPGKKVLTKLAEVLHIKRNVIIDWYLEDIREKLQ